MYNLYPSWWKRRRPAAEINTITWVRHAIIGPIPPNLTVYPTSAVTVSRTRNWINWIETVLEQLPNASPLLHLRGISAMTRSMLKRQLNWSVYGSLIRIRAWTRIWNMPRWYRGIIITKAAVMVSSILIRSLRCWMPYNYWRSRRLSQLKTVNNWKHGLANCWHGYWIVPKGRKKLIRLITTVQHMMHKLLLSPYMQGMWKWHRKSSMLSPKDVSSLRSSRMAGNHMSCAVPLHSAIHNSICPISSIFFLWLRRLAFRLITPHQRTVAISTRQWTS